MSRTKPLVFGIGFHKTGTSTLHRALEILGWKSLHYAHRTTNAIEEDRQLKRPLLSGLIAEGYDAFSDYPIYRHVAELDETYPDARFVYTTRPFEDWWHSQLFHPFSTINWELRKDVLFARWRKHEQEIRERFATRPHKLLEFRICEGDAWDKLCDFLDVPLPAHPWPWQLKRRRYDFRPNDFASRIPKWQKLFRHLGGVPDVPRYVPHVNVLEIGSGDGRTALWWLLNVCNHETSRLYCLDEFADQAERERFLANMKASGHMERVRLVGRDELMAISETIRFDVIYVAEAEANSDINFDRLLKPEGIYLNAPQEREVI